LEEEEEEEVGSASLAFCFYARCR